VDHLREENLRVMEDEDSWEAALFRFEKAIVPRLAMVEKRNLGSCAPEVVNRMAEVRFDFV
jgi:hypothetical protein